MLTPILQGKLFPHSWLTKIREYVQGIIVIIATAARTGDATRARIDAERLHSTAYVPVTRTETPQERLRAPHREASSRMAAIL